MHTADKVKDNPKINGILDQGKVLVFDRYYTAQLAYQCAQGFPLEKALKVAEIFEVPKPDKILLLKITPETSLKRKREENNGNLDRNEKNPEFQQRVATQYERVAQDSVFGPWYVLDGERSKDGVFELVKKVLQL